MKRLLRCLQTVDLVARRPGSPAGTSIHLCCCACAWMWVACWAYGPTGKARGMLAMSRWSLAPVSHQASSQSTAASLYSGLSDEAAKAKFERTSVSLRIKQREAMRVASKELLQLANQPGSTNALAIRCSRSRKDWPIPVIWLWFWSLLCKNVSN